MNVALIVRSTLFKTTGGDTTQVVNTARCLNEMGISTEIRLANEKISYEKYDLLHFFNIIRPADILSHAIRAKRPFVVSTIFVDYTNYDKHSRKGPSGIISKFLSPDNIEYSKVIGRRLLSGESIVSRKYLWLGQRRSIKTIIRKAAHLLPNSENEYRRLKERYGLSSPYEVIPNGIDPFVFPGAQKKEEKNERMVICAARIEGIKNQLNLIKALRNTDYELYLIGAPSKHQNEYYKECRKLSSPNIHFTGPLSQEELRTYYEKAKVHALPSWFETTGLSSLEAASMGCNLVISRNGDVMEYFGDNAFYCDPASPDSIFEAVEAASKAPVNPSLHNKIHELYTWKLAATKTAHAYKKVLNLCE